MLASLLTPSESGSELVAKSRRNRCIKTNLPNLDGRTLQSSEHHDVVEVCGPSGAGKTHLLMLVTVQCVLPTEFGGNGKHVVWFDLDQRFCVGRFCELVMDRIGADPSNREVETALEHPVVRQCLANVRVYQCNSSFQFLVTVHAIRGQVNQGQEQFALMVVDTISAFHWQDTASEPPGSGYFLSIPAALKLLLQDSDVSLFVSKPDLYRASKFNRGGREYSSKAWQALVSFRVDLGPSGFSADVMCEQVRG